MFENPQFKRIIDGKTYNTQTATCLWHHEHPDVPDIEEALYKTRHGAYFLYYFNGLEPDERITPLDSADAQQWLERHCLRAEIIEREFGEAPEAGANEARITLRIPETLRKRIAAHAKEQRQSLNAWILRRLEQSAADAEREERNHESS